MLRNSSLRLNETQTARQMAPSIQLRFHLLGLRRSLHVHILAKLWIYFKKNPKDLSSQDLHVIHSGSLSPTSVLPTIAFDTFSPAVLELNNHNLSPTSCTMDAPSPNLLLCAEKDYKCMTSKSFRIEMGLASSVTDIKLPSSSIKLFGQVIPIITSSSKQRSMDEEQKNGRSSSGSSCGSFGTKKSVHKHSSFIFSKRRPNFEARGNVKGFVPYKRCVAERDLKSLANVFEENDGRKIRVCS